MKLESDAERAARALMSVVLGVPVEQHDNGTEPGMFDFAFTLTDGALGACEMTTLGDPVAQEYEALATQSRRIEGSAWAWMIWPKGQQINVRDLMRHLPTIARIAEAEGCENVNLLLAGEHGSEPAFVWLRQAGIEIHGAGETNNPGAVYPMFNAMADFVHEDTDPVLDWLEEQLAGPRFDGEFDKLERSGRPERHLFLLIHSSGMPMKLFDPLATTQSVPTRPLQVPGRHITGLWLIAQFGDSMLWWTQRSGWNRKNLRV